MTDPGLTDLIAADLAKHRFIPDEGDDEFGSCSCLTWRGPNHDRHVALVVEQHTNGRIAELEAHAEYMGRELPNVAARIDSLTARAEQAEATIARVKDAVSGLPACDKHEPDDAISCGWKNTVVDVRAALEGEQQ